MFQGTALAKMLKERDASAGSKNPSAVLNERLVLQILDMIHDGVPQRQIALTLKIGRSTIYDIMTGGKWSHVTGIKKIIGVR